MLFGHHQLHDESLLKGRLFQFSRCSAPVFIVVVALIVCANVVAAETPNPTINEILRYFSLTAFGTKDGNGDLRIKKWNRPIVVRVKGEFENRDQWKVQEVATELMRITSHSISVYNEENDQRKANINIVFTERNNFYDIVKIYDKRIYSKNHDKLKEVMKNNKIRDTVICFGTIYPGFEHSVGFVLILIPNATLFDERAACVEEELAQSLGLFNDSRLATHSIFNDVSEHSSLTGHDKILLRLLYHPEIKRGANQLEAIRAARNILRSSDVLKFQ